MDRVSQTISVYERDASHFVKKYRGVSVASKFGEDFREELPGNRILDVGCGPGRDLETFLNEGYEVVGLDLSESLIRAARKHVPDAHLIYGDMRELPLQEHVIDGIWSSASFLHIPAAEAESTLREFRRVLAEDGVVFLSVRQGEESGYSQDDRFFEEYTPEKLRTLLISADFEVLHLRENGPWLRILARR